MNRSALRELAAEYARGGIAEADYRCRRAALIDELVTERALPGAQRVPEPCGQESAYDRLPRLPLASPRTRRWTVYAASAILAAAASAWLLVPSRTPAPRVALTQERPAVQPSSPEHRLETLARVIVGKDDWSAQHVAKLRSLWTRLGDGARAHARSQSWYPRLRASLLQEIDTRKTLAPLDPGGPDARAAVRLTALAAALGVREETKPKTAPRTVRGEMQPGPTHSAGPVPPAPAPIPTASTPAAPPVRAAGLRYTLQLFALSDQSGVARILGRYPHLGLRVIKMDDPLPYRVVYGSFASADEARKDFHALPPALIAAAGAPVVKAFDSPGPSSTVSMPGNE